MGDQAITAGPNQIRTEQHTTPPPRLPKTWPIVAQSTKPRPWQLLLAWSLPPGSVPRRRHKSTSCDG